MALGWCITSWPAATRFFGEVWHGTATPGVLGPGYVSGAPAFPAARLVSRRPPPPVPPPVGSVQLGSGNAYGERGRPADLRLSGRAVRGGHLGWHDSALSRRRRSQQRQGRTAFVRARAGS